MTTIHELDRQDGIMWCRPIDAPCSVAWRPVSGENSQHAKSYAEATRVLRRQGEHVTRRRSGN